MEIINKQFKATISRDLFYFVTVIDVNEDHYICKEINNGALIRIPKTAVLEEYRGRNP